MNGQSRNFPKSIKKILYVKQNGYCAICNEPLKYGYHADHIFPYSKGGKTIIENCQLLCPKCNIKKGDKIMSDKFKFRPWQEEAFSNFLIVYEKQQKNNYFLIACPAAGKTKYAKACVNYILKDLKYKATIITLSPRKEIKKQWADVALSLFDMQISYNGDLNKIIHDEYHGISSTYYQFSLEKSIPEIKTLLDQRRRQGNRIIVIMDEVHHLSEENSWGASLAKIFDIEKDFFLLLSGTPIRTDNIQIPFTSYDSSGILQPDYQYSYAQAIRDNICRRIVFISQNGTLTYDNIKFDSSEYKDEINYTKMIRNLLRANEGNVSPVLESLIDLCKESLREDREFENPNAACIVICIDIRHAKNVKRVIEERTGDIVEIVYSKSESDYAIETIDAAKVINDFKNGRGKWIVSVGMISEGVDIPRATHLLYLSNITSEIKWKQSCGRVVRVQPEIGGHQIAKIFIPATPELLNKAKNIYEEINDALNFPGKTCEKCGNIPCVCKYKVCSQCGEKPCVCEDIHELEEEDSITIELKEKNYTINGVIHGEKDISDIFHLIQEDTVITDMCKISGIEKTTNFKLSIMSVAAKINQIYLNNQKEISEKIISIEEKQARLRDDIFKIRKNLGGYYIHNNIPYKGILYKTYPEINASFKSDFIKEYKLSNIEPDFDDKKDYEFQSTKYYENYLLFLNKLYQNKKR